MQQTKQNKKQSKDQKREGKKKVGRKRRDMEIRLKHNTANSREAESSKMTKHLSQITTY